MNTSRARDSKKRPDLKGITTGKIIHISKKLTLKFKEKT